MWSGWQWGRSRTPLVTVALWVAPGSQALLPSWHRCWAEGATDRGDYLAPFAPVSCAVLSFLRLLYLLHSPSHYLKSVPWLAVVIGFSTPTPAHRLPDFERRFPNSVVVRGKTFSLPTCLHLLLAHRHGSLFYFYFLCPSLKTFTHALNGTQKGQAFKQHSTIIKLFIALLWPSLCASQWLFIQKHPLLSL